MIPPNITFVNCSFINLWGNMVRNFGYLNPAGYVLLSLVSISMKPYWLVTVYLLWLTVSLTQRCDLDSRLCDSQFWERLILWKSCCSRRINCHFLRGVTFLWSLGKVQHVNLPASSKVNCNNCSFTGTKSMFDKIDTFPNDKISFEGLAVYIESE